MAYPAVLIHGMWCTGRSWTRVAELLRARGFDCYCPNLPAHEAVPDQPLQVGAKSLKDYFSFLENYIQQQAFTQPPVLIGHSMGGLLAQMLAARIKPLALVLLTPGAPAGINPLRLSNLIAFTPHFLRWGFWRKGYKLSPQLARRYAYNGVPVDIQMRIYDSFLHESGRAICEMGFPWADWQGAARMEPGQVQCPMYVVGCARDGLTPLAVVKKVAALYPQAALRIYDARSHWVIDDPDTEDMVHEVAGWLQPMVQRQQRQKAA